MELVLFLIAVLAVSTGSFWLFGSLYGLIHRPSIYFSPTLALKMSLGAISGSIILGFGGIVLATWLMNIEFKKRADYNPVKCIIAGVIISVICSVITFFSLYSLAWAILD